MYIMKIYVPSMLPKGVETINKQTNKQTSSHNGMYTCIWILEAEFLKHGLIGSTMVSMWNIS